MPKPVRVTKVTVEYAAGGRSFTVVFDPKNISSIVLGATDLQRLKSKQQEDTGTIPKEIPLNALDAVPESVQGARTSATSVKSAFEPSGGAALDLNRSLWWHTDDCVWFHPEDQ